MPRINNETQLRFVMQKLQYTFEEQQNTDVSLSRAKASLTKKDLYEKHWLKI